MKKSQLAKRSFKSMVSTLLVLSMLAPAMPVQVKAAENPLVVSELKVNDLENPLGIDQTVKFRWDNDGEGFDRNQSAYQILVSSTEAKANSQTGDVWDSGKQDGANSFDIEYNINKLKSRTKYYWQVKVWDESDQASAWSEINTFETGIINASEWTAKWIGEGTSDSSSTSGGLKDADWIWYLNGIDPNKVPANQTVYCRKSFWTGGADAYEKAVLYFTVDDYGSAYMNGVEVANIPQKTNAWKSGVVVDVTEHMTMTGTNVLALVGNNGNVGRSGVIAKLVLTYADGHMRELVTTKDSSGARKWLVTTEEPADGWMIDQSDDNAIQGDWNQPDMVINYGETTWGEQVVFEEEKEPTEPTDGTSAPMLRKSFSVNESKEVASARAYISGLGLFDMYINGVQPYDSVLNPAQTQYTKTVFYCAYDVTSCIQKGQNAISVMLGNSFYNEDWRYENAPWRDDPKMIMELDVTYTDGTTDRICSDETWKINTNGPITEDAIHFGEKYDARKEVQGWQDASFDDSSWSKAGAVTKPSGTLEFQEMEPIMKTGTLTPTVKKQSDGKYLVSVPQMAAGWARIAFEAEKGTEIYITYSDKLDGDGTIKAPYTQGFAMQADTYICKGEGVEYYEPRFQYSGYQYFEVSGYPGELTADDITCYMIHDDVELVSELETGNDLVNKLHDMMILTMYVNFHGKPTDTPVYEKDGWTGDANVVTETMGYNLDMSAFMGKFMEDVKDAQNTKGIIPNVVPSPNFQYRGDPVWSTVYTTGIMELYRKFGQESILDDHYNSLKLMANYYKTEGTRLNWKWTETQHSDHKAPGGGTNPSVGNLGDPPEGSSLTSLAYIYHMYQNMVEIATVLDKPQDVATYEATMATIYKRFNELYYQEDEGIYQSSYWSTKYVSSNPNLTKYRQTSNLLPLAFGLVPEEHEDVVIENLVADIKEKGNHLDTGCAGTKELLPMLSKYGYTDVAYDLLLQETYPSWGYMASKGTSLWEAWENTTRSKSHFFLGTYDEWLFEHMAGIDNVKEAYKTFTVKPEPTEELGWADVSTDTMRGTVGSAWKYEADGSFSMDVTVPVSATATVYVPVEEDSFVLLNGEEVTTDMAGVHAITEGAEYYEIEVGSGAYPFVSTTKEPIVVDKTALTEAITTYEAYAEADYTSETWEVFAKALVDAKAVNADTAATQEAVDAAVATLKAAANALKENAYHKMLKDAITYAEAQKEAVDYENVIPAVKTTFEKALADAIAVRDNAEATDKEKFDAALALSEEVKKLEFYIADKTGLEAAIALAEKCVENDYTPTSWAEFIKVLNDAKKVCEDDNALEEDVTAAIESLNKAVEDLVQRVDKSVLEDLVAEVEDSVEDDYAPETWGAFETALEEANVVLADGDATEDDVADAIKALWDAHLELRLKATTEHLKEAIADAEALLKQEANYTAESFAAFSAAFQNAEVIVADPNATQEEVDAAAAELEAAKANLEAVDGDTTTPDEESDIPETGDHVNVVLWVMILGFSLAGTLVVFRKKCKK